MAIVSRRSSWLILAFAFTLLLAPTFFAPKAIAQEAGGIDFKNVLPAATQGGIGVIMLIVYLVSQKKDAQQRKDQAEKDRQARDETIKLFTDQLSIQNETTKLAFEKYNQRTEQMLDHLKTSHEQNLQLQKDSQETTSLLTGTLSRLEVKLDQPVQCPFKEFAQVKGAQG